MTLFNRSGGFYYSIPSRGTSPPAATAGLGFSHVPRTSLSPSFIAREILPPGSGHVDRFIRLLLLWLAATASPGGDCDSQKLRRMRHPSVWERRRDVRDEGGKIKIGISARASREEREVIYAKICIIYDLHLFFLFLSCFLPPLLFRSRHRWYCCLGIGQASINFVIGRRNCHQISLGQVKVCDHNFVVGS